MADIFLKIVNMSISACWVVLAVLLLRIILKKAPKWVNCVLWGIAGLRLVMPFSVESEFSLVPSAEIISKPIDSPRPLIESGVAVIDSQVNNYLKGNYFEGVTRPTENFVDITTILAIVWIIGIFVLLLYTFVSFIRLRRKIGTAVLLRDNICQSENVVSPFVLGIIKPRIYLPFNINEQDKEHVIAHEQAHISRKDHLWKPLGFLILTIHWFNPAVWLGYILLCRDIELACDEKVVKELNNEQRADYSEALLACSVNRRMIAACPLAFGEVGVKDRIKSVLNYKKPAFWIIVVAIVVSIIVAVCFLTNPVNSSVYNSRYETGKCLYSYVVSADKETKSNELVFDITSDGKVYKIFGDGTTDELGVLKESDYTAEELEAAIKNQDAKLNIGNIKNAYELSDCIFLQKSNGTVYLVQFFSDGRIMSVFKLNRIGKSDIQNGSYKLSEEIYFNGSYSYVPNFENDRIEISTNGGMHIYHFIGEELSTGARYEEIKLNKENFSALFGNAEIWSDNKNHKVLLKNNKKAWYHKTPDDMGGYPYMLLSQKDGTLLMVFADFKKGAPTSIRYIYVLEYTGGYDNIIYPERTESIDEAVAKAILDDNQKKYYDFGTECATEGHIIYGTDVDDNIYTVYVLTEYNHFGFMNGYFVSQGGGRAPAVMSFEKTAEGYKLLDIKYAEDGSRHVPSIKEMFPWQYQYRVMNPSEKDYENLWNQNVAYAQAYLNKIGRTEGIRNYSQVEHTILTDVGVSVDVSNKILEHNLRYNYDLGYFENVEDGVRYVYRKTYDKEQNMVVCTKEVYDTKEIVERIEIDSLTGEIIKIQAKVGKAR